MAGERFCWLKRLFAVRKASRFGKEEGTTEAGVSVVTTRMIIEISCGQYGIRK